MVLTPEGRVQEVTQPDLFSLHCRLYLVVHRRPVNTSLSLGVIPRIRRSHRDLCLTLESFMGMERLYILGGFIQNKVTDPQ